MHLFLNAFVFYLFQIIFVLICVVNSSGGRQMQYPDEGYFPDGYYDRQQQENRIKTALNRLGHATQWVENWPNASIKFGQVSAVALDNAGHLVVFHRGSNVWDGSSFTNRHVYQKIGERPIAQSTVVVLNDTGGLVNMWGENLFHMPHGITVDKQGNIWLTDVAQHQVFKFSADQLQKPALVLGEKFVPGNDDQHFCKPSAVAVLASGDFFVADGYCNTRIIKFAPDGSIILQWGKHSGNDPYVFSVPHALTLAEERGLVCVADRERGRVGCFSAGNGSYVAGFSSWLVGPRLFSVAYAPLNGGRLYVVNGPSFAGAVAVRGYVIDFTSGRLVQSFAPAGGLSSPHDVVVSPDGAAVYVAQLNPCKVYKFVDESLRNASSMLEERKQAAPVKPTATVEITGPIGGSGWERWRGAATGVAGAGAGGAVLLAVAACALLRARNKGRKSMTRRRWEYGQGEFKLRRLLERRRFTRVHSEDSDEEPSPMLPPQPPANA